MNANAYVAGIVFLQVAARFVTNIYALVAPTTNATVIVIFAAIKKTFVVAMFAKETFAQIVRQFVLETIATMYFAVKMVNFF
jgi:hypothetical protein